MPIIYLDGPEKAGKSIVAGHLREDHGARIRKWGPVDPDDRVYLEPLISDVLTDELVVWDRGWAAEHVYSRLLNRGRRLEADPFLGEWLYGRVVSTVGLKIILLGPSASTLREHRDDTDLPVEPLDERRVFESYGTAFNYVVYENAHTHEAAGEIARQAAMDAQIRFESCLAKPPHYVGPPTSKIVVVGGPRKESKFPGAWAPFTAPNLTDFGRFFGQDAFKIGWTNIEAVPPARLDGKIIVALGERAHTWVKYHVPHPEHVYELAHPAFALRSKSKKALKEKQRITETIQELERIING